MSLVIGLISFLFIFKHFISYISKVRTTGLNDFPLQTVYNITCASRFFFNLWFLNFRSTGFGRNESSSQPGNTLDDEDIELPDEDEDALEDE